VPKSNRAVNITKDTVTLAKGVAHGLPRSIQRPQCHPGANHEGENKLEPRREHARLNQEAKIAGVRQAFQDRLTDGSYTITPNESQQLLDMTKQQAHLVLAGLSNASNVLRKKRENDPSISRLMAAKAIAAAGTTEQEKMECAVIEEA
jgi:hypothetical protein